MDRTILVVFIILGSSLSLLHRPKKQYRDYEYNSKTDAFYKLHITPATYEKAKKVCNTEGALVMVPTPEDIAQLHGMLKQFPDIGNFVFVGNDGQKHESAEEIPLYDLTPNSEENKYNRESCEVVTRDGKIKDASCYMLNPYICKIEANDAPYDEQCGVYSNAYKYYDSVKSCYAVPSFAMEWNEAFGHCRTEGGHLVVLNSATESEVVKEFLTTVPRIPEARTSYFFFAGIRAWRSQEGTSRVFRTVLNETLEEAGFSEWSDGEPNNHMDSEYCGSIFANNGKYNDVNCEHYYGFICEKEVTAK